jgi:hypothetical protein
VWALRSNAIMPETAAPQDVPGRPPPDALVLRFPPGGPDQVKKIINEARYTHRHHQDRRAEPWYRLSIWADVPKPGEKDEDVLLRLVHAARLGRIKIEDVRNGRFWWTTANRLYQLGFDILKDGEDGEPAEHYSVDLGHEASRETVGRFVSAFRGPEQTGRFTDDSAH